MTCISLRVKGKHAAVLLFCVYRTRLWNSVSYVQLFMSSGISVCQLCKCVFASICSHLHLSLPSHTSMCQCTCAWMCRCLGVWSVLVWGSICVRLTRWEPLAAGSPGRPKSSGRPEAWNPSRPGQMSLCSGWLSLQRPHRPLKTLRADSGSQNADQTIARHTLPKNKPQILNNFQNKHKEIFVPF